MGHSRTRHRAARWLPGLLTGLAWAAGARADIRFSQPASDAGEVRTGSPLVRRFEFVNAGPGPAQVTGARANCGCLRPRTETRVYQPGEKGAVELDVNTLSQPAGPHTWRVILDYQTDGRPQEAALLLSARLVTEITVQPPSLAIYTDTAAADAVLVTDHRPRPLTVTEVRTSSPCLRHQIDRDYRDEKGRPVTKVTLEVGADYPEGRREETLAIYTSDPAYPELRVPVTVVKHPRRRVAAVPAEVTLTAPPGQPFPSRIVLVRDRQDEAVVIDRVRADDPAVVCRWAPGPGALATVKIQVDRSRVRGPRLETTVHIHVSRPAAQDLAIPLTCTPR